MSNNLRRTPRPTIFQRLARAAVGAVGEISVLRDSRVMAWGRQFWVPYTLNSTRVNYTLARTLYANTEDAYKLGAGFAKPIINATAGFMGAPSFTHVDPEADQALEAQFTRWTGRLLQANRNALRDGDVFARIVRVPDKFDRGREVFDLMLVPPEWVMPVRDPLTGGWQEVVITSPVRIVDADGREKAAYTVKETLRADSRVIEYDGRAPVDLRAQNGEKPNPWGFIPLVHIRNEAEEHLVYGCSDLEPVEPFMKAYHDIMLMSVQGGKLFARPKVKFALKNVQTFLADNFPAEETKAGKLRFADKELFLMHEGEDVSFITADTGLAGITTLLKFLFFCIVDVSETPEFAFGTAVASSKASVSEQMVPLERKIRRKRGLFEDPYGELASMFLAMRARVESQRLDTYQVDVGWDELSPKNDAEVATTIKTLVEGLVTGVESGLVSLDAAAESLRQYMPSMLPWLDADAEDDEQRRVARGLVLVQRLKDGQGLEDEGLEDEAGSRPGAGQGGQDDQVAQGKGGAGGKKGAVGVGGAGGEQDGRQPDDLAGAQDPFVYLIHHVHHLAGKGKAVREELHHCPLFAATGERGQEYVVDDLRDGDRVYHVVQVEGGAQPPDVLYDHLGNAYRIVRREVAGKAAWVVAGLKPGQKVVWSDAEA